MSDVTLSSMPESSASTAPEIRLTAAALSSGLGDHVVANAPSSSFDLLNCTVTPEVEPLMPAYRYSAQLPPASGTVK